MFVTDFDDVTVYLTKHRRDAQVALSKYFHVQGIPNQIYMENALEQTSKFWQAIYGQEGGIQTTEN